MGVVVRLEIAAAGNVIGACGGVPFLSNKAPLASWQSDYLRRDRARVFYQPSFLDH